MKPITYNYDLLYELIIMLYFIKLFGNVFRLKLNIVLHFLNVLAKINFQY